MRKRPVIWLGTLGAGFLGLGLIAAYPSKQPSYDGRPLSFWIDQLKVSLVTTNSYLELYPGTYATRAEAQADQERLLRTAVEAQDAVKALGSQCLPYLLRRLSTRDNSLFRAKIVPWGVRLHVLKRSSRVARPAVAIRGQALKALLIMDHQARSAVPELVVLANSTDQGVRLTARYALKNLAPEEFIKLIQHEYANADARVSR